MKFIIVFETGGTPIETTQRGAVEGFMEARANSPVHGPRWRWCLEYFRKFDWEVGNAMMLPTGYLFTVHDHVRLGP